MPYSNSVNADRYIAFFPAINLLASKKSSQFRAVVREIEILTAGSIGSAHKEAMRGLQSFGPEMCQLYPSPEYV